MVDNEIYNLFFKYGLASSSLQQQFNILFREYSKLEEDNPIEHFKYRIKSATSIENKLLKLKGIAEEKGFNTQFDYDFNAINIEKNLDDIVGIRIVCPFISDVYKVKEQIKECFNVEVIEERDYIKNPKSSGYSSYHLKVLVPIKMPNTDKIEKIKAEIQIRTISMDVAACLEHKIFYKKNINLGYEQKNELTKMVEYCNKADKTLENILIQEKKNRKPKLAMNLFAPAFLNTKEFQDFTKNHQEALMNLEATIKQLSKVNDDFKEMSPIEHIKYRIKPEDRIIEKLKRQNKKISFENVKEYVNDFAGFRIVCPFLSDVGEIIARIKEDSTLEIIEEQDYIMNPKANGYASYHMLVNVPVSTSNGVEYAKVEIQIRTMAQEMWAILEERLCYQKKVSKSIIEKLQDVAKMLTDIDKNMNVLIQCSRQQQEQKNIKKKVLN